MQECLTFTQPYLTEIICAGGKSPLLLLVERGEEEFSTHCVENLHPASSGFKNHKDKTMKRLLLMLPLLGLLAACCADRKCAPATTEVASDTAAVAYEEIYAGTFPAADCSGIYYLLRFYLSEEGSDTLFVLDATYLDAEGDGQHKSFTTTGKRSSMKDCTYFSLNPDNGDSPMNFQIVNDTILRMVNDSLKEVGVYYDLVKLTECIDDDCAGDCAACCKSSRE